VLLFVATSFVVRDIHDNAKDVIFFLFGVDRIKSYENPINHIRITYESHKLYTVKRVFVRVAVAMFMGMVVAIGKVIAVWFVVGKVIVVWFMVGKVIAVWLVVGKVIVVWFVVGKVIVVVVVIVVLWFGLDYPFLKISCVFGEETERNSYFFLRKGLFYVCGLLYFCGVYCTMPLFASGYDSLLTDNSVSICVEK